MILQNRVPAPGILLGTIISSTVALTALADVTNCAPAPSGLVGWWAAEGNAKDSAGANNGTLQGGATFAPGKVGQAFNVSPSGGIVVVPDSPSLRLTNELTIEAWVNARSFDSVTGCAILSKISINSGNNGYQFILVGNTIQGLLNSPGTSWPSQRIISAPIISTGVWYHVAFTYDQSAMKLYCNGQLVMTSVIGAHPIATSPSELRISGADNHGYFDGLIDEPSVYNRALSAAEIAAIYNAGSAGKCPVAPSTNCVPAPSGLVGWWAAQGNALDSLGVNNGTLQGGMSFAPGEVGQAFSFNGTDANVKVPASASLNVGAGGGLTIEAWIRPADVTQEHPLVEWNNGSFGTHLWIGVVAAGGGGGPGSLTVNLKDTSFSDHSFTTSGGLIVPNAWQHVAATYNRTTGDVALYINGAIIIQRNIGVFTPMTTGDLYFGLRPFDAGAGERYAGQMDEVAVYNRALTAAEIQAIYSADGAGKCPPSPGNCAPPPAGLVSWWSAEGNPLDSADSNNGTLQGGATFAPGKVGQAFSFNAASGGTVVVPDPANLRLTNTLTIEAWIKPLGTNGDQGIVSKVGFATGNNGYQLGLSGNNLLGQFNSAGVAWPGYQIMRALPITLGIWQHVAWTYDQSAMKLYFNGQPVATNVIGPHPIATTSTPLRISGADDHVYFDGLIDEPSVYNRALSADEIAAIYNADGAGKCGLPPSILVQPQGQTASAGANVIFSVAASGTPTLSYEWQLNSAAIAGATASSLVLTNLQDSQAGTYRVVVSNQFGLVTSSNAVLTVLGAPPCAPPPAGLVSWWSAEGNALDAEGLNNGTLQGGATFAPGMAGQAFSFNPASGTVIMPDSPSLRLTNQLTIEAWINARDTNSNFGMVSKVGGTSGNNGYQFCLVANTLQGIFNSPGQSWPSARIDSGGIISTGVWYHVAFTYDQSAMKLYCNGQPVATNVIGAKVIAATSSNLRISGDDNNHVYFDGLIDEPAVYNRALSAAEIAAIYNAGSAGKCGLPPSILTQPQSQVAAAGSSPTFTVTAAGTSPLSYQWRANGADLDGATGASLTLSNVQPAQAGTYTVLVTNVVGSVISSNAVLTINSPAPCAPPPAGMVSWWVAEGNALDSAGINKGTLIGGASYAAGLVGQAFSFDGVNGYVKIPKSPSLDVGSQVTVEFWMKPDPANLMNTCCQGLVTSDFYHIELSSGTGTNVGASFCISTDSGATYYQTAIAANGGGAVVSPGVWHHVAGAYDGTKIQLYIDGQPWGIPVMASGPISPMGSSSFVCIGSEEGRNVCTSCTANRYFKGEIDEASIYNRALSGAEIAGIYYAGISGKCPLPPNILLQPKSQAVAVGTNVSLAVVAAGTPPLSYQWRCNGTNISTGTNPALTLTKVQLTNAGTYDVVITNLYGSTNSSPATLTVLVPPQITGQPQNQDVGVGSMVAFNVSATGSAPLAYQWYFNGALLNTATDSNLVLNGVAMNQAGSYSVLVSNLVGSATSRSAILVVRGNGPCTPAPAGLVGWWAGEGNALDSADSNNGTLQGAASFAPGMVGQAFNFNPASGTVVVPDSPSLRLTNQLTIEGWINTRANTDPGGYAIVSKLSYPTGNNGYQFLVIGTTLQGLFNSPGTSWPSQRIISGPVISTGVWYHVAFTYDQSAMKLYCNGQLVTNKVIGAHPIATSSSDLHVSGVDSSHTYFDGLLDEVSVYNRALSAAEIAGICNASAAGKCGWPPTILTQPQDQTATAGANVIFTVVASGTPSLNYQWQFNNAAIPGATASSLVLTNLLDRQAGTYQVAVSNRFGSVTSSNAVLTVLPAPPCATPPVGLVSWWSAEGNAGDAAARNNGTLQGGVTFSPGVVGQAFDFKPANGTVLVADSPSLRLTNQLTIEGWINTRANSDPGGYAIVSKLSYPTGDNGYQFLVVGNTLQGLFNSPGTSWPSQRIISGPVINTGVWYHVAFTYDRSAMKLYCNGQLVTNKVIGANAIATSSSDLHISGVDSAHTYFDGLIDEVSIYNRALSAEEIAGIYSAGSTGKCGLAPAVQTPPESQTVECSGGIAFSVTATGMAPLAYQWFFGSDPSPGATTATLTLSNVSLAQAGSYSVVITNPYGSTVGGPAVLTVVDTTPPSVSCPDPKVLEFQDETGAVATYTVTAADICSAVSLVATPPSGSLFPIGVTPVLAKATDSSGNSAQCSFDVTVLGARGVKSNVLAQLVALRSSTTNRVDCWELSEAIEDMIDALGLNVPGAPRWVLEAHRAEHCEHHHHHPSGPLWLDETHVDRCRGGWVFAHEADAVRELVEFSRDQRSGVPRTVVQDLIDRLVRCDRLLAVISIQDAAKAGLNPRKVAEDLAMVAKGDAEATQGHYANAIEHYRNAWRHALQLHPHVSVSPGGVMRLEFVGNSSKSYRIEMSTDLVNWVTLGTCSADDQGDVQFTDPKAANQPLRFYRAVEQ